MICRRVDLPVFKFRRISERILFNSSLHSLKIESAGVMQDPITTTSLCSGSSQAFQRWKQKHSGTSTHLILDPFSAYLSSTPKRDTFSLSYTTGDPPVTISDILKTTWWSGTTTKFSVIAKS
ncbi:hypothetical protein HanRHA438_Chr15g0728221 [Helianthus annuus]|nr:hypothetical protein HanRHA438_Chr15g0728221 [Helianthus annuus]